MQSQGGFSFDPQPVRVQFPGTFPLNGGPPVGNQVAVQGRVYFLTVNSLALVSMSSLTPGLPAAVKCESNFLGVKIVFLWGSLVIPYESEGGFSISTKRKQPLSGI